ncbi:hypothetical protein Pth03_10650 [Planotetraspora thailandica]|uniref:Uncharacterized protein n=1 Tax=Planotetraspora thailandica TaxID=487172 RepID=A0A8J3UXI9_9ACTN|nr:hypothetical protein [Planotetraspora thailandica]GII52676.1 hypothetical protein Pth03_10650 [Planotetraspora thailandica]
MSIMSSYARALAAQEGRAQPVATVRHVHLSAAPMVFIPLRLAGEAAAPLAAMVGTDPENPRLLVVPQPRNRDLRFAFMAELADVMLPYIEGFAEVVETVEAKTPYERYADAPQILVPSRGGVAFTKLLGRSTRFRRADGPYPVHPTVPVLGQWLTFFADRAEYAGSSALVAMTDALALHFATGQSPMEDANLATQLAWISPPDGQSGAKAALAAEDPLISPPAGPDTHPDFDGQVLEHAIRAYETSGSEAQVREALRSQLTPTWSLMWHAVRLLRGLPEAATVDVRWVRDREQFTRETARLAEGGSPRGRVDSAVRAAIRLADLESVVQTYEAQRAFDDPLVMIEHRVAGKAFTGEVVGVDAARRIVPAGKTRPAPRPLVTIRTSDPVRLSPGRKLFSSRNRKQRTEVVGIDGDLVVLQINDQMGRGASPAPGSLPEVGDVVCYAELDPGGGQRPRLPAGEDTPWTHGGPPTPYTPTDEDAEEAWS